MKGSTVKRAVIVLAALLMLALLNGSAAFSHENNELTIDGHPLQITVMDDSTFGVFYEGVNQHYGPYAKGSMIWLNGSDPAYRWGGGSSSFTLQPPDFVPVSHTQPNPWTIVTVYDAGGSGVRVTETVTYTNGSNRYQVKWDIANTGGTTYNDLRFFHGADTYFGGNDYSEGYWNDALQMVFLRNPGLTGIMGFFADRSTPSTHYMEGRYSNVRDRCRSGDHLTDTVDHAFLDAGYALEWDRVTLAPGQTWTVIAYEKWTEAGDVQVYAPADTDRYPGQSLDLAFYVQNFGAAADTFDLAATSGSGWPVSAPASIDLDPGESGMVAVQVIVPIDADPGQAGLVTLEATSQTDPEVNNADTAKVNVLAPPIPTWYLPEGCTKGDFETWILVENPGNAPVQASLAFDTDTGERIVPALQGKDIPAHTRVSFNLNPHIETYDVATRVTSTGGPVVCERAMYGNGRQWATESVGSPAVSDAWYMAEGCTTGGFENWILVQNPNPNSVRINISLDTDQGQVVPPVMQDLIMPAHTRASWNLANFHVSDAVAARVTSTGGPVVAERAMYGPERVWGTTSIGAGAPSASWFLAEGCTGEGFSTWILLQNPLDAAQEYDVDFLVPSQGEVQGPLGTIPAHTRLTFNVADYVQDWEVSTRVTSSGGLVAERSMFGEGWATTSIGAHWPSSLWYFAEGCTQDGMETWVLVQNPWDVAAEFTITLDTDQGLVSPGALKGVAIGPKSRASFRLNDYVTTYDVSARVYANRQVVCERAMYGPDRGWATCSTGYPLYFPE